MTPVISGSARPVRGLLRGLVLLGLAVVPGRGWAQPAGDPVLAETLFQQGKELLGKKQWPEACAKFEASMAVDASVSALLKIARCKDHDGKLAQAWYQYQRALALNLELHHNRPGRRRELEQFTRSALAELEPRLPHLTLALDATPAGLLILFDGGPLPLASLNEAFPVDPGAHEIVATAPDYLESRIPLQIQEGEARTVRFSLGAPVAPVPTASVSAEPIPGPGSAPSAPPPASSLPELARAPERAWTSRQAAGVGVGAAGAALLGVAGYFGLETLRIMRQSAPECTRDNACTPVGLTLRTGAREAQTRGLVLLGAGLGLVGGGVVLIATGGSSPRGVGVGPGGVFLEGVW